MTVEDERVFNYPENFFDEGIPKGVISPSGMSTYQKCPRQYEYSYVKGLIQPPGIARLKGSSIHKGAEKVHKHTIAHGQPCSLEEAVQVVSERFDEEKEGIENWEESTPGQVKDHVIAGFNAYYRQAIPVIKPVAVEKTFAIKVGAVPVRGVIDLIDRIRGDYTLDDDPDQPPPLIEVVADLKTTSKMWSEQQLEKEHQLTFYAIAENTDRVRVDFLLDQKSGSKYVPKRALRTSIEKKYLIEDLEEVVAAIKLGVFPRCNPAAWNCTPKWCGYYKQCRGGTR
jgi:hypothetical protein